MKQKFDIVKNRNNSAVYEREKYVKYGEKGR